MFWVVVVVVLLVLFFYDAVSLCDGVNGVMVALFCDVVYDVTECVADVFELVV